MSDFFKRFLREDPRRLGEGGDRALFLGAFGKHPGWNDHIEEDERMPDLGLRTESLLLAKSLLYVEGIGRNIDSGGWDKLEPEQRLEGFNHTFLWQADGQLMAGRLWSSSDGKGRTRYPMVLAAHALGPSLDWVTGTVLPRLERLREECIAVTTAAEVSALLEAARAQLRATLAAADRPEPASSELLGRFVRHPQFGAGQQGLLRVLYQVQQQAAPYLRGHFSPRGDLSSLRPQDLRVPAAGADPAEVFAAWTCLVQTWLDPAAPVLLLWPVGEEWLDILVGEPVPEQFFCLRATPAKLPFVSEIPFNLDADFTAQTRAALDAMVRGEPPKAGGSAVARFLGSLFKSK